VQYGLFAIDYERVASVVATLETHHGAGAVGQQVNDLPFTLIAPLGADHYHGSAQRDSPSLETE
jgi:hypothetical protein